MSLSINNYPCPECGYEGPHAVMYNDAERAVFTLECGSCYAEFDAQLREE